MNNEDRSKALALGSLFDGSGACPLAASLCGIKPVWASEIEPFPVAVTKSRFPNMEHLGDITKLNGGEIPPVDIITFGSPCQNLSIAGNRKGLGGDQSSLFLEAIRIIHEMREKTNGEYPKIAMWENVAGAFSSNKGEDFRRVIEEFCRVCEPDINVPMPRNGKWGKAGMVMGNDWSFAWRTLDSQHWGVPQRRRRIYAVLCLGNKCAGEILFKREGSAGDFKARLRAWQGLAAAVEDCTCEHDNVYAIENHTQDREIKICETGVVQTLNEKMVTGGNNVPMLIATYAKQKIGEFKLSDKAASLKASGIDFGGGEDSALIVQAANSAECYVPYTLRIRAGCEGGGKGALIQTNLSGTLGCNNDQTLFEPYTVCDGVIYLVRRLTPTECASLQGFPKDWCALVDHKDTPEYKMWGNGMALPCVLYVMDGIADALKS